MGFGCNSNCIYSRERTFNSMISQMLEIFSDNIYVSVLYTIKNFHRVIELRDILILYLSHDFVPKYYVVSLRLNTWTVLGNNPLR